MAKFELIMPSMGESVMEATILNWLKSVGDHVSIDENLVEVATDKVDTEIPSSVEGTIKEILYKEGDAVPVGKPIVIIETDGEVEQTTDEAKSHDTAAPANGTDTTNPIQKKQIETAVVYQDNQHARLSHTVTNGNSNKSLGFLSPLVKKICKAENISHEELSKINGSGTNGRVTKNDILAYVKQKETSPSNGNAMQGVANTVVKPSSAAGTQQDEIVEMDRMRKIIAKHMKDSLNTSAHVTSFIEADVTNIVEWRKKNASEFLKYHGQKLTFTPIFIEAVTKAILEFPTINSSIDGDMIVMKKDINIGMATALPNGNLIVPVIKQAHHKNLVGLAIEVNSMAERAREMKLSPTDIQGGTFTISNIGTFGNIMGTPIINQPQVAILALGKIQKKPAVIETAEGDFIGIRHKMYLSLSYDHRIIDGYLGGTFLARIGNLLEQFDKNRTI